MKNIGQYNQDLSVPRKKDIDDLANVVDDKYSASNPPPYPVTSVNGQTGVVTLGAGDIGALPLTGGTLTGSLVLGNEDAQIKIGEAGVIFNPSYNEPQIVISDSHYATQYISLSSSQTKIVGGTQFTNTNMTLALDGITIQKLENGVPSTATLSGISDGVNDHDAVNLRQLNSSLGNYVSKVGTNGQTIASSFEAANSIKAQTGGEVNNTIELLSSDVAPSLVATSSGKSMSVSFVPQYSEVSFNTDDNVTLTGIKAGTNDTDAVNVGQLNATIAAAGGLKASDILFVYVAINRLVGSVAPFGNGLYLHTITSYRSLTITVKDGPTVATNELQAIVPLFSSGSISARDISIRFFDNYITSIDYLASVSDIPESLTIWCYAVKK